jgi:peptide/nickel transport system substrate-binding protein
MAVLLLAACGAPAAPATDAPAADAPAADAPAAEPAADGPILTDAPADAGERPVQAQVYNSPEEYAAATGSTISGYNEAPELAELVASGALPPVEERLPAAPVVVSPEEAIGKYGGPLRMSITGQNTLVNEVGNHWVVEPLTVHSPQGEIVPNVAQSWEWSDDNKVLTLSLREGIKWSDGVPFTADDVVFWWEDVVLNTELTPAPPTLLTRGGEMGVLTKIDDYTVQIAFSEPYALFTTYLGSWGFSRGAPTGHPRHYLSQFHPNYAEMESIEAGMEEGGFDTWTDYFTQMAGTSNPDKPTIGAWMPEDWPPQSLEVHTRNPYYWKVDSAGNQLPYIGEIWSTRTADREATILKTIAGELDFSRTGSIDLALLTDNKASGNYRFAYADWMPNSFGNIMFNFTTADEVKRELYNDVNFRRALSVAIDREEIIKLIYKGGVFASQVAPMRGAPYFGESELFQSWTQFDPELTNQMLDEIGLTERDSEGFRLAPNGEELLLIISATAAWPAETPELMELVKGYWANVGIKATVTPEAGQLWTARHNAGEHDISARGAHFGGGPVHPTLNSNTFALAGWQWAPDWALWLDTNGEQGVEPPDDVKRLREIREQILGEADEAVRNELIQEVFQIHMDNLWSIGLVVDDPRFGQLAVVHNRLRNVVTHSVSGEWYPTVPAHWFINE